MAKKTWMTRATGVLLPVSSLPSKYGVGTFGQAAREWVTFSPVPSSAIGKCCPWGPPVLGIAPYQSYSAFAGNPLFIDLQELCNAGLLKKGRCKRTPWGEGPLLCGL